MKTDDLADLPETAADQPLAPLSPGPCVSLFETKRNQYSKIQELGDALADAGYRSLDERARVLDLSRSTTWSILKGKHKNSGLSASVIIRILSAPHLPTNVRAKIHEYVAEKSAGRYGNSKIRLREFADRLSHLAGPESESTNGTNNSSAN